MESLKYVAAGFLEDSKKLISTFTTIKSLLFTDFSKIWRDMKFSYVFWGREKSEMEVFTEQCFKILTAQLTPQNEYDYKCGLLFTLYGMYFKQLSDPKVKIRLTMSQFADLASVVETAERQMNLDVCFIFYSLFYNNAFHFVCHPTPLGPRRNNTTRVDVESIQPHDFGSKFLARSVFKTHLNEATVDELTALHEHYESLKEIQTNAEIKSLKTVTTDAFKCTKRAIKKLEKRFGPSQNDEESEENEDDDDTSRNGSDSIVSRRAAIRRSQFEAAPSQPAQYS